MFNCLIKESSMMKRNFLGAVCAALLLVFAPILTVAAESPQDVTHNIQQVDINKADARTIAEMLVGVGMVRAEEIVAYRTMFGNFTSVDELLEVPGIGAATLEKNRSRITLSAE